MKKNKIFRRGLALLLAMALIVGLIPEVGRPLNVKAADDDKTIVGLGADAIANPVSPESTDSAWEGSYVYFGRYGGTPVKYRVLSKNTTDFGGATMLLDCDSILWRGNSPSSQFDDKSNMWRDSKIKKYLNSTFLFDNFSVVEQNAITRSTKAVEGSTDGEGYFWLNYAPLLGEKIFLLDAKEVTNTSYGYYNRSIGTYGSRKKQGKTGGSNHWWIRSDDPETEGKRNVGYVQSNGNISFDSIDVLNIGVSPALNLKLSSILFSSVISGTAEQTGTEYKLTLLDSGMHITTNGDITQNGDTITIPYTISGGNATRVSVLILDKEYTAGNVNHASVLAYEKLSADSFSANGTGTFTFPAKLSGKVCGTDYHAYLIAEKVNGQEETDYASEPVAIDLQETKKVSSVQIMLEHPMAGHAFDTTAECSTEGVKSVSAAWEDADGQPVNGNAGYNRIYTVKLTITPEDGYVMDTTTSVQWNDGSKAVENITLNPKDGP